MPAGHGRRDLEAGQAVTFDIEALKKWTTASLVMHLAQYATNQKNMLRENAELVAAELNARIPPRVLPAFRLSDPT